MSSENDRGRPGKDAPNDVVTTTSPPSVNATSDFVAALASVSGPEDPVFLAAGVLADAWKPALDRSYRLGYDDGYTAGFYESERLTAESWRRAVRPVQDVLAQPTREEFTRRRGET